jgi:hypothetical protein
MPQRERFIAYISCPQCNRKGAATWRESEHPVYHKDGWGTTLTRVSQGFRAQPTGNIFCADCNIEVVVPQCRVIN